MKRLPLSRITRSFTVLSLCLLGVSQPLSSLAAPVRQTADTSIVFQTPLDDEGMPSGRQSGTASRGDCYSGTLAAIVPQQGRGLTTQAHPTFWVYLPPNLKSPLEFKLSNLDSSGTDVYSTRFTPSGSGLMRLSVPETAPPLQVGKTYTWSLSVICQADEPSRNPFVQSDVQRRSLSASLESQITSSTPLDQAKLLAAQGLWYDALDTLAQVYRLSPDNQQLAIAWTSLLQQVKLESLAQKPFVHYAPPAQP